MSSSADREQDPTDPEALMSTFLTWWSDPNHGRRDRIEQAWARFSDSDGTSLDSHHDLWDHADLETALSYLDREDDLYSLMNLPVSASADEIRTAFRRARVLFHPDRHLSSNGDIETAKRAFVRLSAAYEILSDKKLRREYDQKRAERMQLLHLGSSSSFVFGRRGPHSGARDSSSKEKDEEPADPEMSHVEEQRQQLIKLNTMEGRLQVSLDVSEFLFPYDPRRRPMPDFSSLFINQKLNIPWKLSTGRQDIFNVGGFVFASNGIGQGALQTSWKRFVSPHDTCEAQFSIGTHPNLQSSEVKWTRELSKETTGDMSLTYVAHRESLGLNTSVTHSFTPNWKGVLSLYLGPGHHLLVQSQHVFPTVRAPWPRVAHMAVRLDSSLVPVATYNLVRQFFSRWIVRMSVGAGFFVIPRSVELELDERLNPSSTFGLSVGLDPRGVKLGLSFTRSLQRFSIPIVLTKFSSWPRVLMTFFAPICLYAALRWGIVQPRLKFLRRQRKLSRRRQLLEGIQKAYKSAQDIQALLKIAATQKRNEESARPNGGLIIERAVYGRLYSDDEIPAVAKSGHHQHRSRGDGGGDSGDSRRRRRRQSDEEEGEEEEEEEEDTDSDDDNHGTEGGSGGYSESNRSGNAGPSSSDSPSGDAEDGEPPKSESKTNDNDDNGQSSSKSDRPHSSSTQHSFVPPPNFPAKGHSIRALNPEAFGASLRGVDHEAASFAAILSTGSDGVATMASVPFYLDVTTPLQQMVRESVLMLHDYPKTDLPGFADLCPGEKKFLRIQFWFSDDPATHYCVEIPDHEELRITKP